MNLNVILAKRENEVTECIAWGGSYKETASLLQISVRTVDNTLRKVKEKLGLNKINEISAWWFCTPQYKFGPLSFCSKTNIRHTTMYFY